MNATATPRKLIRPLMGLGYHPGIVFWVVLYVARFGTVDGCPWVESGDLPAARALIGQRTPTDFRPDPVAFRAWKHANRIEEPSADN